MVLFDVMCTLILTSSTTSITLFRKDYNTVLIPLINKLVDIASGTDLLRCKPRNLKGVNAMKRRFASIVNPTVVERPKCEAYLNGGAGVWLSHHEIIADYCLRRRRELTDVFILDDNDRVIAIKPGAKIQIAMGLDAHVLSENSKVNTS